MSEQVTVRLETGFVLHQRPYRNSSQLVEFLSAHHGRVGLVARGSRRMRGGKRASLQPFRQVRVSWTRRGELGSLIDIESEGPALSLRGRSLMSAYYVNELMLRMTIRDDPNPAAFHCYTDCLAALQGSRFLQRTLRLYELSLLDALGYGLQLAFETTTHAPIDPESLYAFDAELGPREIARDAEGGYRGRELIALRERRLDDEESLRAARRLLGAALESHLGGRGLRTRGVLEDMAQMGLAG